MSHLSGFVTNRELVSLESVTAWLLVVATNALKIFCYFDAFPVAERPDAIPDTNEASPQTDKHVIVAPLVGVRRTCYIASVDETA